MWHLWVVVAKGKLIIPLISKCNAGGLPIGSINVHAGAYEPLEVQ